MSRIGNLYENLVVVSHPWQGKNSDGANCPTVKLTHCITPAGTRCHGRKADKQKADKQTNYL